MEFPRIDPFGSTTFAGGVRQITLQKLVIECGQDSIFDRTISFRLGKEGRLSTAIPDTILPGFLGYVS
ncbi:hypothetical protein M0804_010700 [Polistes exclamans]|nr:hypothetical protein M0804_010700 [Polistes exclamans]